MRADAEIVPTCPDGAAGPFDPYERALASGSSLWSWDGDRRAVEIDIDRWRGPADETDLDIVRRSRSPVLDIGCGPGRIVAAMNEHGRLALGVDTSARAVAMTRAQGLNVVRGNVFDPLPGEQRWRTIVVLDGSIGIGGDLPTLLERLRELLLPDGRIVVETHPDPDRYESRRIRLGSRSGPLGAPFAWTSVGALALVEHARGTGLTAVESWTRDGRTFVTLRAAVSLAVAAQGRA